MKSEAQKTVEQAREMIKGFPWLETEWRNAWGDVLDVMEPLYKAVRPAMKSFEVHHVNETIRLVMLTKLVNSATQPEAVKAAIEKGKEILTAKETP